MSKSSKVKLSKYDKLKELVARLSVSERDIHGCMSEKYYRVLRMFQDERAMVISKGGKI